MHSYNLKILESVSFLKVTHVVMVVNSNFPVKVKDVPLENIISNYLVFCKVQSFTTQNSRG